MFRFEQLEIWKSAIKYTTNIYLLTKKFPKEETFSLTDQLRRSATSIAANIAEGSGGSSKKDFCHYLDISIKSTYESVSHLEVAKEQHYITEDERIIYYDEAEKLARKIRSFKYSLLKTINS